MAGHTCRTRGGKEIPLGLPFRKFGASILRFWDIILAPGAWATLEDHWEQQDVFEVVNNRIFVDFAVIFGDLFMSVFGFQNTLKCILFSGLFPGHLLSISDSRIGRLGLRIQGFR